MVTPYQEEQGGTGGCAPEEQGPQGLRQDPWVWGVESRAYPWAKRRPPGPYMVPES